MVRFYKQASALVLFKLLCVLVVFLPSLVMGSSCHSEEDCGSNHDLKNPKKKGKSLAGASNNPRPMLRGLQQIQYNPCHDQIQYCDQCDEQLETCETCMDGYFALDNGQCAPCYTSNCQACSADGEICHECMDGYQLYQGQCALKITFDDLPTPDNGKFARVPEDYKGFHWSFSWRYIVKEQFPNIGYGQHSGSDPHNSYNYNGNSSSFWVTDDEEQFSLKQMKMVPAWRNGLQVTIRGFDISGNLKGTRVVTLGATSETITISFGGAFEGLAKVVVSTPDCQNCQVVMDDILLL